MNKNKKETGKQTTTNSRLFKLSNTRRCSHAHMACEKEKDLDTDKDLRTKYHGPSIFSKIKGSVEKGINEVGFAFQRSNKSKILTTP